MNRREFLCVAPLALTSRAPFGLPTDRQPGQPFFREVAREVGVDFHHFTGATGEFLMPEIMGAGVALFDYDNDGDLDVYLIQGTMLDPSKPFKDALFPPPPGWKPGNRLFRNLLAETGKLQFVDVTEKAGVGHVGYGMGVAVGDYDNDGYQDLYVTNFGHNVLYHNNGDGTFTDVTRAAGVDDERWSTSAAWVDYDRDGRLDLYLCSYIDFTVRGNKRCNSPWGEQDYCTPRVYRPAPDRLFRNLGNGRFEDVTEAAGIGAAVGPGLGVLAADFNGDGWMDFYVANDSYPNFLWLNQGNGTFKEVGLVSGTSCSVDGAAQAGMGVSAGDFDNDGDEDLVVTNLSKEGCNLFVNDGKGNFYDAASEYGLFQPTFPYTGFGTQWFDYDNDGWLDLFITNGAVTVMESLRGSPYPFNQVNLLFHNEGAGKLLRDVSRFAGPAFTLSEVGRGSAFGDIDNDGRIDLVVSNNNGPARLFLNETESQHHWLQVRLETSKGNRYGLGALVEVHEKGRKLVRRVHTDSSYLSANDVRAHFGLGMNPEIEAVVVQWLDGQRELWERVRADALVTLRQGTGRSFPCSARLKQSNSRVSPR